VICYRLLNCGAADEAIVEAVHRSEPPPDLPTREWACVSRAVDVLQRGVAALAPRLA